MQITQARYEGDNLILSTTGRDALRFVYGFKPGEYTISKTKKKRSIDANAYCWVLCTKISDSLGIPKDEIYRRSIQEGNEYTQIQLLNEATDEFCRVWATRGIGWFTEIADTRGDWSYINAYHGSSSYDTKAMSKLIDRLVQDAKALDIETLSERELSLLKEEWH